MAPARRQDREAARALKQLSDVRRRLDDLLEVVEDEEEALAREVLGQPWDRLGPGVRDADGLRDRGQHEFRLANGRQLHEEDPVGEDVRLLRRHLERETSLPRPSRPSEGDQPV